MSLEVGLEIGAGVWVPCQQEVWRSGVVAAFGDGESGAGTIIVEVDGADGASEKVSVPRAPSKPGAPAKLHLRNEALKRKEGALAFSDLGKLPILHEPAVLHALQVRFGEGVVYTLTGTILLAVNPFREVPGLYSLDNLRQFADLAAGEEAPAPHIFGVARAAYQGVWHHALPQTVLVSGESGAGKTETTKFVMRFLALAGAGGGDMSEVERQVLESIPLLEALGNAKTLRNDNSSRFGKYIKLQFGRAQEGIDFGPRLVNAHMLTYLLEKVRVTAIQEGERSYHIFYQAIAAAARRREEGAAGGGDAALHFGGVELRGLTGLELQDKTFAYLRKSSCTELGDLTSRERVDEAKSFEKTLSAFQAFGIGEAETSEVLNTIVAILYLGNVNFVAPKTNSEGSEVEGLAEAGSAMSTACRLLAVDAAALAAGCCTKKRSIAGEGVITSAVSVKKAMDTRDALARHLYGTIFAFVVERVNSAVSRGCTTDEGALPFVGVLDIFGFEFFKYNSFEQLCINFTNELLQQYFNEVIFKEEARLYTSEGIPWNALDFPDNTAKVDTIGKDKTGILPMLHEECFAVDGGNPKRWVDNMAKAYGKGTDGQHHFEAVKHRPGNFIVKHFAGPVEYASEAFLEKNRDQLSADLVQCLKASSSAFVRQRMEEHGRTFGSQEAVSSQTGRRTHVKAKQYSVSSEFRDQLMDLMRRIRSTEPHFVRCLKPNPENLPNKFNRKSVVEQLQYQGVLQAIEVSRSGYPMRLSHRQGVLEYRCLVPVAEGLQLEAQIRRGKFDSAAQLLFKSLLEDGAVPGLTEENWAVGATRIFLKRTGIEVLSAALSKRRHAAATTLQAEWRCFSGYRRFQLQRAGALRLQAAVRGLAARKRVTAMRRWRAALRIQRCERGRVARSIQRRRLNALKVLQAWFKGICQKRRFHRTMRLVFRIQRWMKRAITRARATRYRNIATIVQKAWRGHQGRREAKQTRRNHSCRRQVCRRLLLRWRGKVCDRLLQLPKYQSSSFPGAEPAEMSAAESSSPDASYVASRQALLRPAVAVRLEEASIGELVASTSALIEQLAALNLEAAALRLHKEQLVHQAKDLEKWTVKGMLNGAMRGCLGDACAGHAGPRRPTRPTGE